MPALMSLSQVIGLVFVLFMGIVLIPLIVFLRAALKANATRRWPSTEGRVVASASRAESMLEPGGTHNTVYEPRIAYEYNVGGQSYRSQQLSYGAVAGKSDSGWARGMAARYPEGTSVQVFYNPAKPAEAVLERAGAGGNLLLVLIMVVVEVILAGVGLFVMNQITY
jgi:hypothetical protein